MQRSPPNGPLLSAAIFCSAAAFGFVLVRARSLLPWFTRVRPGVTTVLSFVALSGVLLVAQLLWFGWQARDLNPPFTPRPAVSANSQAGKPRIVWIILDELSYRQVYGHRSAAVALPNFDHLAATSTIFTHASAPAEYTRIALPSLLTGQSLAATSPSASGQTLRLHAPNAPHWVAFNPHDTLFADVADHGLPTSVAGWYEPYCRLLTGVLDRCFWTYSDDIPGGLSGGASIGQNLLTPLRLAALSGLRIIGIGPGAPSEGAVDVQHHAADFRHLSEAADELLRTQNAGLIFIHMPIPHPWGFFDRRTGTFPPHRTSYLDNLALADLWLGHIRSTLEQDGSWDRTTVIIMGDHGWRTDHVWKNSGFWTAEDQQASQGATFPDAPAVIIKLAGQSSPARIDTPFGTVRTRALVRALTSRSVQTPDQLAAWVASGPGSQPASKSR